jgi:ATP-dependent Clp protease ATP-binding subunit ClpA
MGAVACKEASMDAANLLKPLLARKWLHYIGATTIGKYRTYIEKDAALERHFQQVIVREASIREPISILRGLEERYEDYHGVTIANDAIVSAATLAARYLTARRLPGSAVDLIEEAAAAVRFTRIPPEVIYSLEGKLRQLKIEIHALSSEKDEISKTRLDQAKQDANNVEEELRPLRDQYENKRKRGRSVQAQR